MRFVKDRPGSDVAVAGTLEGLDEHDPAVLLGATHPDTLRLPDEPSFGANRNQHVRVLRTFLDQCVGVGCACESGVLTHALDVKDEHGAFFVCECPDEGFLWYRS